MNIVAGAHSMLKGNRPARPVHPELSDHMWKTIRSCWKVDPTKRMKITDVVSALEAEVYTHKFK